MIWTLDFITLCCDSVVITISMMIKKKVLYHRAGLSNGFNHVIKFTFIEVLEIQTVDKVMKITPMTIVFYMKLNLWKLIYRCTYFLNYGKLMIGRSLHLKPKV